jgi:hypothetical protein
MRPTIVRKYQYRSLPCNVVPDDQLWCVEGFDLVEPGGGVLEWCRSESDAQERIALMLESGEFERLSYSEWKE